MELKLFPWDKGEKPYFVDGDTEWYVEKSMTRYAQEDSLNGNKGLKNCVVFFVKKEDDIKRVLIDDKQNVLHMDTSMEGMACKIDILKYLHKSERK